MRGNPNPGCNKEEGKRGSDGRDLPPGQHRSFAEVRSEVKRRLELWLNPKEEAAMLDDGCCVQKGDPRPRELRELRRQIEEQLRSEWSAPD